MANKKTTKKYTGVPYTAAAIRHAVIGNEMYDGGKLMVITAVGKPYFEPYFDLSGYRRPKLSAVFDFEAKERVPSKNELAAVSAASRGR